MRDALTLSVIVLVFMVHSALLCFVSMLGIAKFGMPLPYFRLSGHLILIANAASIFFTN